MNCSDVNPVHEFDSEKATMEFQHFIAQIASLPERQADADAGDCTGQ